MPNWSALPYVTPVMATELQHAAQYYRDHQTCVFCQLVAAELRSSQRLVGTSGPFVACCAYAGRQPYETWILPRAQCQLRALE